MAADALPLPTAARAYARGGHQVLVRRSVQFHLTDWFNE